MPLGVLRTKSLDAILKDAEEPEMSLSRTLGATDIIMLGIGAIIGAGIFSTVGTAAAGDLSRPGAGPALVLSFVITAVVCGFTALCYAEFASMVPISGSAYTYSYATLGEVVAWIIGWDLIIEYAVGNVGVAISWAAYFRSLLELGSIHVPDWLAMDYRTYLKTLAAGDIHDVAPSVFGKPFVFNILAAFIVALLTVLLVWGVRESAKFNTVMVGFKLLILAFFVIAGFAYIRSENYVPFAPNGFKGISSAAAVVFFAYIGFDAVSTVAEETRDPKRNMPIGIIGSLIVCTVLYIVVAAVFTGLISYTDLTHASIASQAEPLTYALRHAAEATGGNLGWLKIVTFIVAVGAVIATTAVLLVFQMGQPRIFFSMARDGLLPSLFARIHPKFRTPACYDHSHGRLRGCDRRCDVDRRDGGPHEHRNALRVHPGLRRCDHPKVPRARPRAAVQGSGWHCRSDTRDLLLPVPHVFPAVYVLVPLCGVAQLRLRDLHRLWSGP